MKNGDIAGIQCNDFEESLEKKIIGLIHLQLQYKKKKLKIGLKENN